MKQGKGQDTHDSGRNIGKYSTIEQQIRAVPCYLGKFTKKSKDSLKSK